jgi:SHS2 domain-containing protein
MTTDYTALIKRLTHEADAAFEAGYGEHEDSLREAATALRELQAKLAERDALRQRLEAAEKDAERYRGIRDNIGATDERIDALLLKYPLDAAYRGEHKP